VGSGENASCFQNVDLELTFEEDVTPLLQALGATLMEMHRRDGFASFELRHIQPRDPDEAIDEFWRLVRALPTAARTAWNGCRRRTMNIGVRAPSAHSVEFAVSQESVERLHELGADLVLTVYRGEE
jgi:hypothetical protein